MMKRILSLLLVLAMVLVACASCSSNAPAPTATPQATEVVTEAPTAEPTAVPTEEPTAEPTAVPTEEPTAEPTAEPTVEVTEAPTAEPTVEVTEAPTAEPTVEVTEAPTAEPTVEVTEAPTAEPTVEVTEAPTAEPTAEVTEEVKAVATDAPVVEATAEPGAKEIVVLFTSDVHCGVNDGITYAGVAGLRDMVASQGKEVILVDDGDAIQGESLGSLTKGEAIVKIMGAVGYDVATIGNHEFDYGMETFLSLAAEAQYTYVCSNFMDLQADKPVFDAYKIIERDGRKIAFVGVATPRTFTSSTPVYFQNGEGQYIYGFCEDATGEKLYANVQASVDAARADGADYVVVMAHLGTEAECTPWMSTELIANTTGIDALLDGHAHEVCDKDVVLNKEGKEVVRAACGTKLANVGYLTIAADGTITSGLYTAGTEENPGTVDVHQNAEVAEFVGSITAEFDAYLNTIVAHTDYTLTIVDAEGNRAIRNQETNLGDLVADAYRTAAGADVAMVNGGGIRVTIDAGDITMNQILKAHPFGNILTCVEASGQQILDALEWATRKTPGENGGFLHVSGLTYEIHTYLPDTTIADDHGMFAGVTGEYRVKNVMINGEPLDVNKTYTVASHNYMLLEGGDGACMFMGCKVIDLPETLPDYMVVINYILNTMDGNVGAEYAEAQGRIVIVSEPETVTTPTDLEVATPTDVQ